MHKDVRGVIFVLLKDSKILMQLRDENCKRFPLMWCLPGGASDENENYDDTLLREVEEEYGIKLVPEQCKFLFDYEKTDDMSRVYVCHILKAQNPILQEGKEMKWMNIEEIENLKLGFDQDKIIPLIKARLFG